MKRVFGFLVVLTLVAGLSPAVMAGGGGKKQAEPDDLTPEQQAVEAYNSGISARNKAWKLEEKLAEETDTAQQAKLAAKVEKTYRAAAKSFKKATGLNPEMYEALNELGYSQRKLGNYEDALVAYDKALELEPSYAQAIEYRAEAYLGLGRLDDAKHAYMKLFEGQSDQAPALLEAMQQYAADNPDAADFSAWVTERAEIAGQTKSISELKDADW
jgi:tetratricopeptide (TPR) repeat protein